MKKTIIASVLAAVSFGSVASDLTVTMDNYIQAETDWNFAEQQTATPINVFDHKKQVTLDTQQIIRSNMDVVYSTALVDVSEGATFTVPANDGRFQIIHLMDGNHLFHKVVHAGESVTIDSSDLTTGDYVFILARTQIKGSAEETAKFQHAMTIEANSARDYVSLGFDADEVVALREKLIADTYAGKHEMVDGHKGFGATFDDVEEHHHRLVSAIGWGGLPSNTAQYTPTVAGQGSADACQSVTFPVPSLDYDNGGFYSLTVYNAESWIDNDNSYIGHEEMQMNEDGTATIHFNCPSEAANLTVAEGWNGTFRMYMPLDVEQSIKETNHMNSIQIVK